MDDDELCKRWWDSLSSQQQIIVVLRWAEDTNGCKDSPSYMAEKPWKWMKEAWSHMKGDADTSTKASVSPALRPSAS